MPARRKRGGRPSAPSRGVSRRPAASRRPARRSSSPSRSVQRNTRRQGSRQATRKVSSRPRPVVRPAKPAARVISRPKPRPAARSKPAARPRPIAKPRPGAKPRPASQSRPTSRPRPQSGSRPSAVRPRTVVRPSSSARPRRTPAGSARQIKRGGRAGKMAAVAGTLMALNAASAPSEIATDISSLQFSLNDLQERATFSELETDIANLDSDLNHALNLLESARDKGYKYQSDLEDIAYQAMGRWQKVRDEVKASIQQNAQQMSGSLNPVNTMIQRLNGALGSVSSATSAMGGLRNEITNVLSAVDSAEDAIEAAYADIESDVSILNSRLSTIHWMLTQLEEATIDLDADEDLYLVVKARWDKEGKEDPEGALFLTNQRLMFERKEKLATKKILFITTASELVQEVMIAEKLSALDVAKSHNKGLFGHQDFLDIAFENNKVGKVSFHINGQSSEGWSHSIRDAKSGKIEEERTSGAGLSFAELTGEITSADIMEVQTEVNELQDEMMLRELQDEISELENETSTLTRELGELRNRGYLIEKGLEADIEILALQWKKIKERASKTLDLQSKLLGEQMKGIQGQMAKVAGMTKNLAAARPLYVQLKSAIASAEAQAEAAEETVYDQYDEYADEVESLHAHFEWIDWMLDAIETASFQLLATESGVSAVEAVWERPGAEPENGVLFLTDQRFLWEDREDTFELKFNVAVSQVNSLVEEADEETGEETLVVDFSGGAPVHTGRFLLAQPVADVWIQIVNRAKSGGYVEDRAVKIEKSEIDRIRNAPTNCSNCSAAFTAPILRGQTEIICEYCGTPARI